MQVLRQHIAFKFLALIIVLALFAPSVDKFVHTFSHHEHKVCNGDETTHFHEVDLDCEFYKFQLNKNFTISKGNTDFLVLQEEYKEIVSQYLFLSDYQRLHFSLRGPPQVNLI
ncbi:hypothetical protein [Hyunsoonleella aestuarii]|uniref:Uncharacterized protein n=1 Tax=Hyunsoonleella aestuarii TaxID=912802 RepID=A0ABP8EBN7_9FLAO|nr:hypothetical protein [Hyunsoonleella aestuarii]